MRILVQALVAAPGGSLTVLRDLVAAWPAEDELLIVCWRPEAAEALGTTGHRVVRVEARSTEGALLRLRRRPPGELLGFRPDVVWSQAVWVGGYEAPQAVHYRDIGSFVPIHPPTARQRLKSLRERRDVQRADLRIYNSATMRDAVHARYPAATSRPHMVIHNGLDLSGFSPAGGATLDPTTSDGTVRILLPQGDAPHKRNWLAADVLSQLRSRGGRFGDVRLTVVGRGEYADLRAALARHGLKHAVEFTGHVSRHEIASLYASHDVVLMTGLAESFGNPIVEAHASGRPVASAPFAVARELDGPLLHVAEMDDAGSLSLAVEDALGGERDGDRGAAVTWANRFTADRAAGRIKDALAQMCRDAAAPTRAERR
jgi:glycosyltransferase involved in cell wall biosynthesis